MKPAAIVALTWALVSTFLWLKAEAQHAKVLHDLDQAQRLIAEHDNMDWCDE